MANIDGRLSLDDRWYREPLGFVWKLTQANPPAEQRVVRILKVARTVADLEGAEDLETPPCRSGKFSAAFRA